MSNFHVGQKVVCINDRWHPQMRRYERLGGRAPVKGQVYTVRGVDVLDVPDGGVRVGIFVDEIRNPIVSTTTGHRELSFIADCFRPVAPRKTDISVFTALLNTTKTPVPA